MAQKMNIVLTAEVQKKGWSNQTLSYASHIAPQRCGGFMLGTVKPYPAELQRLATALGFLDDPARLLDPVEA